MSELNAMLQRGLDPSIPASEKTDLVQGSDADPELINRAAQAARAAGVVITVTEIQSFGADAATATATLTVNGQDNVGAIPLVYEGGKWKLQKQWACDIVTGMAQMHSPACE
ncbi:hypothetical protein [Nocardia fluminea]|uniref:hypothetical protein n=1 Tax=Nocardia fluminea TaxID=134984 RepID=UPI003650C22C